MSFTALRGQRSRLVRESRESGPIPHLPNC
jgi:hypothetical protein